MTKNFEKREWPEPSAVWLSAAFFFLACAAGTLTAALTLSPESGVHPSQLWIATVALIVISVVCFLAHWDVNRGRKPKRYEVKELPRDE
jgi:heme/copper-type cytochrome/quinol oxidase subunit 3